MIQLHHHLAVLALASSGGDLREAAPVIEPARHSPALVWLDLDGDGLDDAMARVRPGSLVLLRNRGDGSFEDITACSGLDLGSDTTFAAWNHLGGGADLFLGSSSGPSRLFRNQRGTFEEVTAGSGIAHEGLDRSAEWLDFDRDGRADLLVATTTASHLYHGLGEGRFELVPLSLAGMADEGLGSIVPTPAGSPSAEGNPQPLDRGAEKRDPAGETAPAPGRGAPGRTSRTPGSGGGTQGVGGGGPGGVPSNVWSLFGNLGTDPTSDFIGTADATALSIRTNSVEHMLIAPTGGIAIHSPLAVGQSLTVGSTLDVGGDVTIQGVTRLQNATPSTSPLSGALVVTGGVGVGADAQVGEDLSVAGNTLVQGHLSLWGGALVGGGLFVAGPTRLTNSEPSGSPTSGALVVSGGVGVGADASLGGSLRVAQNATVDGVTALRGDVSMDRNLGVKREALVGTLEVAGNSVVRGNSTVRGDGQVDRNLDVFGKVSVTSLTGAEFPLSATVAGTSNKFTMDKDGQLYLRSTKAGASNNSGSYAAVIDGQDQGLLVRLNGANDTTTANHFVSFWSANNVGRGRIEGQTLDEMQNSFEYIWTSSMMGLDEAFVIAEGIACGVQIDLGEVAVMAVEGALAAAEWIEWLLDADASVGVAYESGSGDYAEWLEKADPADSFTSGDIVGVHGGKISRDTQGAEYLMVVSMAPIVLGNTPPPGQEERFEKVAFLGQVPVKVKGVVELGDYVLASGANDGTGYAVAPEDMRLADHGRMIGVAWSASTTTGASFVKVAVGLDSHALAGELARQQGQIDELQRELASVMAVLGMEREGAQVALGEPAPSAAPTLPADLRAEAASQVPVGAGERLARARAQRAREVERLVNEEPELLRAGLQHMREAFEAKGLDVKGTPELARLFEDETYFFEQVRALAN